MNYIKPVSLADYSEEVDVICALMGHYGAYCGIYTDVSGKPIHYSFKGHEALSLEDETAGFVERMSHYYKQ